MNDPVLDLEQRVRRLERDVAFLLTWSAPARPARAFDPSYPDGVRGFWAAVRHATRRPRRTG